MTARDDYVVPESEFGKVLPVGYVATPPETGKLSIKTERGWVELDRGRLPKEEFPQLYALLRALPKETRWQRFQRWLRRQPPPPETGRYGETEDEFNLPDFRGRIVG